MSFTILLNIEWVSGNMEKKELEKGHLSGRLESLSQMPFGNMVYGRTCPFP